MTRKKIKGTVESLEKLFDIVDQSLLVFEEGVKNYLHRDMVALTGNLQSIVKLQNEASLQSREIQTALYTQTQSMSLQGDIYRLLEQMLFLIDMCNNNLFQFEIERPNIPSELNADFLKLTDLSSQCISNVILASRTYFRDPVSLPEKVRRVSFYRKEADRDAKSLKKRVFQQMNELKLSEKTHLRYFALHIEELSMQSMKIADQLSVMSIRRGSEESQSAVLRYVLPAAAVISSLVITFLFFRFGSQISPLPFILSGVVVLTVLAAVFFRIHRVQKISRNRLLAQEDEISNSNRKLSEMEARIISMENDHLQNLLDVKRKEATGMAGKMSEQKDFLDSIYNMVVQAESSTDREDKDNLLHELKIRLSLRNNLSDEKDFYSQVESLHQDFSTRLAARFPQLTAQERKLAMLLRLEFSSKYIAMLLNISTRSVEVERHRMRSKMGLERGQNLTEFIKTI